MSLFLCSGTSVLGIFADYVWASDRDQAVRKFWDEHGVLPHLVTLQKRGARP